MRLHKEAIIVDGHNDIPSVMLGSGFDLAKSGTADYEIPTDFSLRQHAQSRQAWEIGDGDRFEAVVEFTGETGAVTAAAALGAPHESSASLRRFQVRRADSFARWLLSFAGDATPVSPAALVSEYASLVEHTRAVYGRGPHE